MVTRSAFLVLLVACFGAPVAGAETAPSAAQPALPAMPDQTEREVGERTSAESCDSCTARKQHLLRKHAEREEKAGQPTE